MDNATLASLRAALAASPRNVDLLTVVVAALVERGEATEAARLVRDAGAALFERPEQRRAAARALFAAGDLERSLELTDATDGETQMLRARVLHALGRPKEAVQAYQDAVAENPTLEDVDLKALLGARIREIVPAGERPRMRVISNDDTDAPVMARLLHPEAKAVTFADVGGLADVKKQIERRIIMPFQKPSLFQRFKKRVGGGILLYGPPGCGKTLLARATAGECKAGFFNVAIHDILDMYIGESERKLHAIFEKARSSAPAVLFFDELEALAGKRQHTREATSAKLVSQFLAEMDGFAQNNAGVLILGATNVPWAVDAAFRRPGRFDRVLFVPPPDREGREAILRRLLDVRPSARDIDVAALAARTSGFSGADLEHLVETASDEAIEASLGEKAEVPIAEAHLVAALRDVKPTTLEWLTTARNYARYANEAGQYDEVLDFLKRHGKG
ncbi:ATP-binding protein [Sorangium sp. So ce302]|uniref:ATP-binding protein n=1 Tax=Sorangium sp. So ce302 TaxID=3133297 RepID=UPI003F62FDC8